MAFPKPRIKGANKAFFEILIHEIQGCKGMKEVNTLLDSWITANDLHPENVQTRHRMNWGYYIK